MFKIVNKEVFIIAWLLRISLEQGLDIALMEMLSNEMTQNPIKFIYHPLKP